MYISELQMANITLHKNGLATALTA